MPVHVKKGGEAWPPGNSYRARTRALGPSCVVRPLSPSNHIHPHDWCLTVAPLLQMASATAAPVAPFGNEAMRAQWKFADDPYQARWECMHAADNATAVAFDRRGHFLAIGTAAGEVLIWDVTATRQVVAVLRTPVEEFAASASGSTATTAAASSAASNITGPAAVRGISHIAWSANSRLLFAVTASAMLVTVWDVESGVVQRAVRATAAVRFVKPHPLDSTLVLLVPWYGMPQLVDWTTGDVWQVGRELRGSLWIDATLVCGIGGLFIFVHERRGGIVLRLLQRAGTYRWTCRFC